MKLPSFVEKYEFFRLPVWIWFSSLMILAFAFMAVHGAMNIWGYREDYSFGYILPVFSAYVLYDRWGKIMAYFSQPATDEALKPLRIAFDALFFLGFSLCVLLFLGATLIIYVSTAGGAVSSTMCISLAFMLFGFAYLASGENLKGEKMALKQRLGFARLFIFPAFIWIIAVPFASPIEDAISVTLLSYVSVIVVNIMDFFGAVVELHGNVISFPGGSVGVADACSGIRSLTACLFAGSFLAAVFLDKFWKKIALVGMAMVFAFIFNLCRALFLAMWAYQNGSDSISGTVHDLAGYFVLGMTVICLLALLPLFQLSAVPKAVREAEARTAADELKAEEESSEK